MTKAELDKKHLAELHALAAEAGIERYRMLPRAELVAKLADGDGGGSSQGSGGGRASKGSADRGSGTRSAAGRGGSSGRAAGGRDDKGGERPPRRRRRSSGGQRREPERGASEEGAAESRPPRARREQSPPPQAPEPAAPAAEPTPESAPSSDQSSARPRRRRRRRFGRRGKQGVTLQGLLLPPANRQALLAAESREACTALLRGIAADLTDESNGPDPVALLIDPSPEELADWRRDAPQAEIVAAGQPRHADDALAQAVARASRGDHVILLVDSLTRLGEAYDDADAAKKFFDAGSTTSGSGSLTVVAALERTAS